MRIIFSLVINADWNVLKRRLKVRDSRSGPFQKKPLTFYKGAGLRKLCTQQQHPSCCEGAVRVKSLPLRAQVPLSKISLVVGTVIFFESSNYILGYLTGATLFLYRHQRVYQDDQYSSFLYNNTGNTTRTVIFSIFFILICLWVNFLRKQVMQHFGDYYSLWPGCVLECLKTGLKARYAGLWAHLAD